MVWIMKDWSDSWADCIGYSSLMNNLPSRPKKKEPKMLKKLVRKAITIWCLYGVVKLCVVINPFLFAVAKSLSENNPVGQPWGREPAGDVVIVWLFTIAGVALFAGLNFAFNKLTDWIWSGK